MGEGILIDTSGVECCCDVGGVPMVCHGIDFVCQPLLTMSVIGVTMEFQNCSFEFSMDCRLELIAPQNPTWISSGGDPVPGAPTCLLKGSWELIVTGGSGCGPDAGGSLCGGAFCVPPCSGTFDLATLRCNADPDVDTWIAGFGMISPSIGLGYSQPLSAGCPGAGPWTFLGGSFGQGQLTGGGTFTIS